MATDGAVRVKLLTAFAGSISLTTTMTKETSGLLSCALHRNEGQVL